MENGNGKKTTGYEVQAQSFLDALRDPAASPEKVRQHSRGLSHVEGDEDSQTRHARDVGAMLEAHEKGDRMGEVARRATGAAQKRNETIARLALEASEAHGLAKALWSRLCDEVAKRKELKKALKARVTYSQSLQATLREVSARNTSLEMALADLFEDPQGEQARAVAEGILRPHFASLRREVLGEVPDITITPLAEPLG